MSQLVQRVCIVVTWCLAASTAAAAPCPPADVEQQPSEIVDGKLAFCADPNAPCWVIDNTSSTWTRQPAPSRPSVTVSPEKVTACAAGGKDCVSVTGAFDEAAQATANDDRTLLAVWSGATVVVYDTKTAKKVSTIAGWKSPIGPAKAAQIQHARFVGARLVVWESWTPVSSAARLFDPRTGKRIADIGKAGAEIEPAAVPLGGDRWAFAGFDPKLYVVNIKTGKLAKAIKLPGGQNGRVLPGTLADGRVVIISDGVVAVDVTSGKVTPMSLACHE